MRLKQNWE